MDQAWVEANGCSKQGLALVQATRRATLRGAAAIFAVATSDVANAVATNDATNVPFLQGIQWDEPKRKKSGIAELAQEFTVQFQKTQWGVSGRVQPRFFADGFIFKDPDVSTNGLQAYAKGVGTILSNCRADAIDVQVVGPDAFDIRWRIAGSANAPFQGLKIKPYVVTSTFKVNSDGLVASETDTFSIPSWDILLSAVADWLPFLAPPEPPVQSPFA